MLTVAKSRLLAHASVRRNVTSTSQSTLQRCLSFLVSRLFCFSTARQGQHGSFCDSFGKEHSHDSTVG